MNAVTTPLDAEQAAAAAETSRQIQGLLQAFAGNVDEYVLRTKGPSRFKATEELHIPAEVMEVLVRILDEMGKGNSVQIMPVHAELTTQEVASLLNVSRPHVVKLIEDGRLPARKVGTHRRIRLADLLAFKELEDSARRERLDELTREAQELGIGYQ